MRVICTKYPFKNHLDLPKSLPCQITTLCAKERLVLLPAGNEVTAVSPT